MDSTPEKKEHIFRSKLPDIYIPSHLNLHTYCFEHVSKFQDRPCLIDGLSDKVYTYADVHSTTRRTAAGLCKLGIKKGDVILLLLQNSPQFVYAFIGGSYLGAAITTANPFFTAGEIIKQATAANVKLIVTQAAFVDKVKDFSDENNVKIVVTDSSAAGFVKFSDLTSADETDIPEVIIDPDDTVALPFSSGTTGLPKGVMLTHKCMVTGVAQQVDGENPSLNFTSSDVILCVLPIFHIYCLSSIMLSGLRVGAAILIMPRFEINRLFELVDKYKVTVAPFVPPIILAIAKNDNAGNYDLSSVKLVMSGAAPMGKELEDVVRSKLPNAKLGQGYGMTESASAITLSLAFAKHPMEVKPGACGTVIRNAEMKIVDPETGDSLPRNHAGEICIRGNQIMKGYLNDKKATEKTIDEEGWLHTGDVGYVDDDGEVFIVDRLKEMIKYKGFQVAPAELEALLVAHPHISDGAVVSMQDEVTGEVPVAFVVRSNGSNVSENEIKNYISNEVVFYKRINRVFFVDSIPKSPAGKILRKDLRACLAVLPKN